VSDTFTSAGAFTKDDIGKTLVFRQPWYKRLWLWIKYVIFRRPRVNLGTYVITGIKDTTSVEIEGGS
jgi:hypothetical protein